VKEMDGVVWAFPDWQATKATALRKAMALKIRQTRHVAEPISVLLAAAISECFTRIMGNVIP